MQKAQVIKKIVSVTVSVTAQCYDGLNKTKGGPS